jgi:hypothetical protein
MRGKLILSGCIGLAGNAGLMLLLYLLGRANASGALERLAPNDFLVITAYLLLLGLALAEIPLMVSGLRIVARSNARRWLLYAANVIFVFFSAFYAALFIVLSGHYVLGLTIAGTGLLRLAAGAVWIARP